MVTVYGVDHPGIVHAAATALAGRSVDITDLNTRLLEDDDGDPLYVLMMEVALPPGLTPDELEQELGGREPRRGCGGHPARARAGRALRDPWPSGRSSAIPNRALKEVCRALADGEEPGDAAADLLDTMSAHPGCVGLAAPQIGAAVRIVAVDVSEHPKAEGSNGRLVLVNPVVVREDGAEVAREGCLSIPHLTANVRRATTIEVEARGARFESERLRGPLPAPRDRPPGRTAVPGPRGLAVHATCSAAKNYAEAQAKRRRPSAGDRAEGQREHGQVEQRAGEAAGVVQRGVERVERGLEREDGRDHPHHVVERRGHRARGHQRQEGQRQREHEGQQRGGPHLAGEGADGQAHGREPDGAGQQGHHPEREAPPVELDEQPEPHEHQQPHGSGADGGQARLLHQQAGARHETPDQPREGVLLALERERARWPGAA